MVASEIQEMPIENIIRLPNFHSLERNDGVYSDGAYFKTNHPHWIITLRGDRTKIGTYICCGSESPHEFFRIYKLIKDGKIQPK